jgi:hypothetical protein
LVKGGDSESIDLFLHEEDARRALNDIRTDEPEWAGLFYVEPVELDERDSLAELGHASQREAVASPETDGRCHPGDDPGADH